MSETFKMGYEGAGKGESRSWASLNGGEPAVTGWGAYWRKDAKSITHELKTVDRYYDAIVDGRKTFEVRLNDRAFQTGDILRLVKTNEKGFYVGPPYTVEKRITYILQGGQFGIEPRYCVLGLGPVTQ